MTLVEKISCTILIVIYLFLTVLLSSDLIDLFNDPVGYSWVYHFDAEDNFWSWSYFRSSLAYLILIVIGIFIAFQNIKTKSKKWRIANLIATIFAISAMGIKYLLWAKSGFDH